MGRTADAFRSRGRATWVVCGPFMMFLVVFMAFQMPAELAAYNDSGTRGTWTATGQKCGRSCWPVGDFVSADGSDMRRDVSISGRPHKSKTHIGEEFDAIDTGGHRTVFVPGSHGVLTSVVFEVVLFVLLGVWIWTVPVRAWKRRRAKSAVPNEPVPEEIQPPRR